MALRRAHGRVRALPWGGAAACVMATSQAPGLQHPVSATTTWHFLIISVNLGRRGAGHEPLWKHLLTPQPLSPMCLLAAMASTSQARQGRQVCTRLRSGHARHPLSGPHREPRMLYTTHGVVTPEATARGLSCGTAARQGRRPIPARLAYHWHDRTAPGCCSTAPTTGLTSRPQRRRRRTARGPGLAKR